MSSRTAPRSLAQMFRRTVVRRIVAVVVMFGLGMFMGESFIADGCVEHATQVSISALHDHANHATTPSHGDGHSAHVCHCTHAHTSELPAIHVPAFPSAVRVHVAASVEHDPLSITLEPQLRPPLA